MDLTNTEREAIGLCVCLEAVNEIVNHALLDVRKARDPMAKPSFISRIWYIVHYLLFGFSISQKKLEIVN